MRSILSLALVLLASAPELARGQPVPSAGELVQKFKSTTIFWQQFEIAKKIVEAHDTHILPQLESLLENDDRHLRGNAAYILAAIGDELGFGVITTILEDASDRPEGQGSLGGRWSLRGQIISDRYYAVHLLGELKDPKAVPILIPLLQDEQVNYKVPWALGEIGGPAAVQGLIGALSESSTDVRVVAIEALEKLNAKDALPDLRRLLGDNARSDFGEQVSVAEAARKAIFKLEQHP